MYNCYFEKSYERDKYGALRTYYRRILSVRKLEEDFKEVILERDLRNEEKLNGWQVDAISN